MLQKTLSLIILIFALTACSTVGDWFEEDEAPPLEGERISVLELQRDLEPDDTLLEAQGLITPPPWKNALWPQSGGYPNHSMQNLALAGGQLKRVWKTDIGRGSTDEIPLTASPIIVDGMIYTLNTKAELRAYNVENGREMWEVDIQKRSEDDLVIGGGIAYSNGSIFVTNGYDEVIALDHKTGEIQYRAKIPAPIRAAPTIVDGRVFVTTLDNKLIALNADDGSILWEYLGIGETAALVGAASPAANRDVVIPVFSSGEISAIRAANGSVAWSDNLANTRGLGGLSTIADIKALPVIDKGLVVAISFSGRIVAIDERTGVRVWQREISGSQTPWMAGNHLFVISSDNKLIALGRESGVIRWVTALPIDAKDPTIYTGPLLAGGRLIMVNNHGIIVEVSPETGEILREWESGIETTLPPIIADQSLYLLGDDGTLAAFR